MIKRYKATVPFLSAASVHNGVAYISGQVASDKAGEGFELQTKAVFTRLDELLEQVNSDKEHILMANIWLVDMTKDFSQFNELWMEWLEGDTKPSRACVEAAFGTPKFVVEIALIAAVKE